MNKLLATTFVIFFAAAPVLASQVRVGSPDKRIELTVSDQAGAPTYRIDFNGMAVIGRSSLGFLFEEGDFSTGIKFGKVTRSTVDESYELVVGKVRTARSHYNEAVIPMVKTLGGKSRTVNLVARVFDDAVAFRYEFPEQDGWDSYVMHEELTRFDLAGNPEALVLEVPAFINTHEGLYTRSAYGDLEHGRLIDMPATMEYGERGVYVSITEAAVRDYAGMYLVKDDKGFRGQLSPNLANPLIKVIADLPHRTPWRVIQVSDRVGALIESTVLTSLNDPCAIGNTSWIKPGKTTFTWWNGNVVPDTTFSPGNNFETNKYYIDFAARNGLDFHSVYGYAETPWYTDDGFNFGWPGPNADITRPIAPLNMKHICDYAKSVGVDIHVWVHWLPLYQKLEEAFTKFNEWGVVGMMVDFMDRDDQEMIRIQEEILQAAARHKLFIQFHGSSKPSGLHRTYPNEFTREGTLNYEVSKWDTVMTADHDIHMPFTRLLAGAADYHLGGFRAAPRSEFKVQYTNPMVMSTRCHMLGMYIVMESYLGMVCDTPKSYEGQPGFEFLRRLPTVWDDTKVPAASFCEFVTIARQKDGQWYVGTINNGEEREIQIPLSFLGEGSFTAEIYRDTDDADINPNNLVKTTETVTKDTVLTVKLAADGGSVMHIY